MRNAQADLNLRWEHVSERTISGPSCSKHRWLNKLVSGRNVNCSSKYNILVTSIFAEKKMWVAFANAKATHIFPAKILEYISIYAIFNDQSFNDTLTNDIVSFEQLGPDTADSSVNEITLQWTVTSKKSSRHMRTAKTTISHRIRTDWSWPSISAYKPFDTEDR